MTHKLLLAAAALLLCVNAFSAQKAHPVQNGVLDLSSWNTDEVELINIEGPVEFYWNKLYTPDEADSAQADFRYLPGLWNSTPKDSNGKPLPINGYATYRLKVLLPSPSMMLALRIDTITSAYTLYINGKKKTSVGTVGTNKAEEKPGNKPRVIFFQSDTQECDILLQMSNFHHENGGLWRGFKIGTPEGIKTQWEQSVVLDMFLVSALMIMGIYHVIVFLLRKKEKAPLYFALFCFLISIRTLSMEQRYITIFFRL